MPGPLPRVEPAERRAKQERLGIWSQPHYESPRDYKGGGGCRATEVLLRRLFTPGPNGEGLWVRLCFEKIDDQWAAMILPDEETPPPPGGLKGLGFFAETLEEAEQRALDYLRAVGQSG